MSDGILAGYQELDAALADLLLAAQPDHRMKALMAGGFVLERAMKLNTRSNGLHRISGNLVNAITAEPEGSRSVTVGPRNVIYAAIHEYGGIITPKKAKYLAIPLTSAAKKYSSPRSMPGLHVQGNALVDAQGKAQFALVKSVTIPARPYVRPALDEHGDEALRQVAETLDGLMGAAA